MKDVTVTLKIQSLGLPEVIEKTAISLFQAMPLTVKKWRSINGKAYFCISEAYKKEAKVPNAKIMERLEVTNRKARKFLKNAARAGYHPILHHYRPHDFVPLYARFIGITSDYYQEIYQLLDLLLEDFPMANEQKPQTVAAGVIAYYAKNHGGYELDTADFAEKIGFSCPVIDKSAGKMSMIENRSDEDEDEDVISPPKKKKKAAKK